jgi:hypothetical protein
MSTTDFDIAISGAGRSAPPAALAGSGARDRA